MKAFELAQSTSLDSEYGTAAAALEAATIFDSSTTVQFQYEITALFDLERTVRSYQARVKDIDGFGVGYVALIVDRVTKDKVRQLNVAVSQFVSALQEAGDYLEAAQIAALVTLPPEQQAKVYDALTAGLSKAQFIKQIEAETGANLLKYADPAPTSPVDSAPLPHVRLGSPSAAHAYNLGVNIGGGISYIEVDANDRAQARRIAEKAGYEVRDVNMIG